MADMHPLRRAQLEDEKAHPTFVPPINYAAMAAGATDSNSAPLGSRSEEVVAKGTHVPTALRIATKQERRATVHRMREVAALLKQADDIGDYELAQKYSNEFTAIKEYRASEVPPQHEIDKRQHKKAAKIERKLTAQADGTYVTPEQKRERREAKREAREQQDPGFFARREQEKTARKEARWATRAAVDRYAHGPADQQPARSERSERSARAAATREASRQAYQQPPAPEEFRHPTSKAYQMMSRMGWAPGRGLGKDGAGTKDFIKPAEKRGRRGLKEGQGAKLIGGFAAADGVTLGLSKQEPQGEGHSLAVRLTNNRVAHESAVKHGFAANLTTEDIVQSVLANLAGDNYGGVLVDNFGDTMVLDNADDGGVALDSFDDGDEPPWDNTNDGGVALGNANNDGGQDVDTDNDAMVLDGPDTSF